MEMKFIITESKQEKLIDKYLSKEYGGLKKGESKNHPDLVFFIRDDDHNLTGNDVVFHYTKDNGTYAGGQRQSEKCKSVVEYGTKNPTD